MLDHAVVDIFDAFGEGFDRVVVPLDGKDGLLVEIVDLFEDVEGNIATGEDKIEIRRL